VWCRRCDPEFFSEAHRKTFHRQQISGLWGEDAQMAHLSKYFEPSGCTEESIHRIV